MCNGYVYMCKNMEYGKKKRQMPRKYEAKRRRKIPLYNQLGSGITDRRIRPIEDLLYKTYCYHLCKFLKSNLNVNC